MPTYCYRCRDCGASASWDLSYVPAPDQFCPECGGDLRRDWRAEAAKPLIANLKADREGKGSK